MIYETEVAVFLPNGHVREHRRDVRDEPWVKGLEDAWRQAQEGVDVMNSAHATALGLGRSWANREGPRRLVGVRLVGPSEKHHWTKEPPYVCRECGAQGYVQCTVPLIIMATQKKEALCKGRKNGKD